MAKFRVRITADKSKYPLLLSNGNLVADGVLEMANIGRNGGPFSQTSILFALVVTSHACQIRIRLLLAGR